MSQSLMDVRNLDVDVKVDLVDGVQRSVETRLFCKIDNCGRDVDLCSDGRHTLQEAVCPVHGKVGFFPSHAAFREFTRFMANGILEADGHEPLTNKSRYVHIDDQPDPNVLMD